jgi:hypothetical protein
MVFSIQNVLRQLSPELLMNYLNKKGLDGFHDVWKLPKARRLKVITERLIESDEPSTQSVLADFVRIHPLATERGRNALLSADSDEMFSEQFGLLGNDWDRALWALMTNEKLFQVGEELHFFDHYAEGSFGQHYRTGPNHLVSRNENDICLFRDEVRGFYRHRDGSGISCYVESTHRTKERAVQITLFVQGLPNNSTEFVDGRFRRTISYPAIEAAIVYESETGNVTTVAKGGKPVHEVLREAFAEHLLKADSAYEPVTERRFRLDRLKSNQVLPADPELGIRSVRIRKLKLIAADFGGHLTVEARGPDSSFGVCDLGNRWFVEKSEVFGKFQVVRATIALHFQKRPHERRSKTINLELSAPNGSNLKSLKEEDRKIAEAHIEKWNLIEPANPA